MITSISYYDCRPNLTKKVKKVKMRRITKRIVIFILGALISAGYCEYLIYFLVVGQCSWPVLDTQLPDKVVKAFVLADIHMLGPWWGHWLDKWRREWQMHRAYQTILTLHKPEAIFILGDIFDEGEWTNDVQFEEYVERFYRLFSVPNNTQLHIVVGNHDVGFHNKIRQHAMERFITKFNSPSIQHVVKKDNHFVLLNSMALHGDTCHLCTEARKRIQNISDTLDCLRDGKRCGRNVKRVTYSRPILMQHFPLHRNSDAVCADDQDAPPLPERNKKFRTKIDSLSKEATDYIVQKVKPRVVFGGHTHHGCLLGHTDKDVGIQFAEYSVPSFSWRNRPNPKYLLVTIAPDVYAVNRCGLPLESSIVIIAVVLTIFNIYFTMKIRLIGR